MGLCSVIKKFLMLKKLEKSKDTKKLEESKDTEIDPQFGKLCSKSQHKQKEESKKFLYVMRDTTGETWWNIFQEQPKCAYGRFVQFGATCWVSTSINIALLSPILRKIITDKAIQKSNDDKIFRNNVIIKEKICCVG